MKLKLFTAAIFTVLILPLFSGCSIQSIDKQFKNAVTKSSTIQRASNSVDLTIKFDIENSNLSTEERTLLMPYSSINVSIENKYDMEKKLFLLEGNTTVNGMSINFKLYKKDDKTLLEIPALSKYIVINEGVEDSPKLDETTQIGLMDIINKSVTKDTIKKIGTDKLTIGNKTSEVTRFDISLSDSDIKNILNRAIDLFSSDKLLKNYIINSIIKNNLSVNSDQDIEESFTSLVTEIKQSIDNTKIENFQYKGAFNKDLIFVEEDLSSNLTIQLLESKSLKMNIQVKNTTYDINKYLDFEMPVVDKYNSISIDDLYNMMNQIN